MRHQAGRKATSLIGAVLLATVAGSLLPGPADGYTARRTTRTAVRGGGGVHHRDVSVRRDIDIDIDYRHHRPVATAVGVAAAVSVTAAAIGTIVHSLPPACSVVVVNGITYQNCGGAWYQPQYAGTQITYVVVNPPQ